MGNATSYFPDGGLREKVYAAGQLIGAMYDKAGWGNESGAKLEGPILENGSAQR